MSDLQSLLERLMGATGPDREASLREQIRAHVSSVRPVIGHGSLGLTNASIDAATDQILELLQALIASKSPSEPSA